MSKKGFIITGALLGLVLGGIWEWQKNKPSAVPVEPEVVQSAPAEEPAKSQPPAPEPSRVPERDPARPLPVPFTVQAPNGKWSNPIFQNGCEEAAILMAERFLSGDTQKAIPASEAIQAIEAISHFQKKKFGTSVDTSAEDTLATLQQFYKTSAGQVKRGIQVEDMVSTLKQGELVLVPADGQKLHNPHYTAPGPPRHMLVIIGYDPQTKEFITNDAGTRYGAGYRYAQAVVFDAILDYPTGDHAPAISKEKVMITVRPQ